MRFATAFLVVLLVVSCSSDDSSAGEGDASSECCTVTVTATVPEGTGTLYLSGNVSALGPWDPDGLAMEGSGRERVARLTIPAGTDFEYKFTLGEWDREAVNHDGTVPSNHELSVESDVAVAHDIINFKKDPLEYFADWEGSGVLGTLVYWPDFESGILEPSRHVEVWLPPGYEEDPTARYPVLYMSDGQNLFDPRIANTGVDWGVDEAVVRLVEEGVIPPVIVVGAWSTGDRFEEYSPWHGAPEYARFLSEELMPRVDAEFRTLTGPENTAVMGSSMGGLLSYYLVTYHPDLFGACGCESTHFPLSEAVVAGVFDSVETSDEPDETPYIVRDIESGLTPPSAARYYFAYGTEGLDAEYGPTHQAVRQWLLDNGFEEGEDFVIREYEGADHNEAGWRARIDDALTFIFGAR